MQLTLLHLTTEAILPVGDGLGIPDGKAFIRVILVWKVFYWGRLLE